MDSHLAIDEAVAAGTDDRFEFRIFRPRLGAEAAILADLADLAGAGAGTAEASLDRYLLAPGRPDAGLKLRGGRVELKTLERTDGALELWHPWPDVALPATGAVLAPLFAALDRAAPPGDAIVADVDALARWAEEGANPGADLVVATLRKRRRRYRLAGAAAEIGAVRWNGSRLETLAVEGTDPAGVAALVARLGLAGAPNTSYPRLLCEGRAT